MAPERRTVLGGALATFAAAPAFSAQGASAMYGLIGQFTAKPGQRDVLIDLLLGGSGTMAGCLLYVIAKDATDPDLIWITEVWDNQASHDASLKLPSVQAAIAKARPLIAGVKPGVVTVPVGGVGLKGR